MPSAIIFTLKLNKIKFVTYKSNSIFSMPNHLKFSILFSNSFLIFLDFLDCIIIIFYSIVYEITQQSWEQHKWRHSLLNPLLIKVGLWYVKHLVDIWTIRLMSDSNFVFLKGYLSTYTKYIHMGDRGLRPKMRPNIC